ncbi:MAG: TRAP transporter TatT component family protein [Deltaproteobacteria bacterium]|nr:TRAP transporter TatT component family protein [Deltaproteobacteria bacterium]
MLTPSRTLGYRTYMRRERLTKLVAVLALVGSQAGCLSQIAAGSTASIVGRGSVALSRMADPEFVEAAIPGSAATLESLMITIPSNEILRLTLTRSYASFGFGFMVEHMEDALTHDDMERADHFRARGTAAFLRARTVGFEMMSIWEPDDGGVEGNRRNLERWRNYLRNFERREQGGQLFWTAYAWVNFINLNKDDPDAVADLPFVIALAERAKDLDHEFNDFAPHALLAGIMAATPPALGGRPDLAMAELEYVIQQTRGQNLMYRVILARNVAVPMQNRELFRTQLQLVLDAGDVSEDQRLSNVLAKRRARRYLAQIDDLFLPDMPAESAPAGEATAAETPASN